MPLSHFQVAGINFVISLHGSPAFPDACSFPTSLKLLPYALSLQLASMLLEIRSGAFPPTAHHFRFSALQ